jgi:helix-turn-helix protein
MRTHHGGTVPLARTTWAAAEPLHAVVYFAPEVRTASEAAGLRGFWRGYFALRAAPLGPVGPQVVTALFYNFAPSMVARAVPEVWQRMTPDGALAARLAGVDGALRALVGEDVARHPAVGEAAPLARALVEAAPVGGRPLGAAVAGLPWPAEPHLVLWQAVTALRELRGDGHNAALLGEGIDGCAAHVLFAAVGGSARSLTQPNRGWTDDDWDARVADLTARGLVARDGHATEQGRRTRAAVEAATDRVALDPATVLGPAGAARLLALLTDLSGRVVQAGVVPVPNPMGAPWPPP